MWPVVKCWPTSAPPCAIAAWWQLAGWPQACNCPPPWRPSSCVVTLAGIDSVMAPQADRLQAWQRLARDLDVAVLEQLMREIALEDALAVAPELLAGQVRGRVVVRVGATD